MESRGSKFRDHEFTTSVLELDEGKKHRDKRNPIAVVPFILGDCPVGRKGNISWLLQALYHNVGCIYGLDRHL